jgi:predicted metal-dependent peptidase
MNPILAKKIQNARIKLFKKSEGLSFFGACSYMFDWNVHMMPGSYAEGYVLFDKDTQHVEDGTIHINEELVQRDDYTHIHLAYIICHELLHVLGKHGVRKGNREHHIWCAACDHVVERDLKQHANAVQPYDNAYHMYDELHKQNPNCTVEQAYTWLQQQIQAGNIKVVYISSPGGFGDMVEITDQNGNKFMVSAQLGGVDNKNVKGDTLQAIQTSEKIVSEARALHQTLKAKGDQAGGITSLLDKILAVKIPWEVLLEKAIKTNVILKPDERSWKNPNKIWRPHGITLPGVTSAEERDGTGIIIYCTDSSGSMSDQELKKCSSVTEQSFQYFKEVWLYVHDTSVHQKKVFDKDEKHMFYHFLKNEGYKGRGGTSHLDVFKKIQDDVWENNGLRDELSMVICLTDGYSDIETVLKNKSLEWTRVIPIVFVISGQYNLDLTNYDKMTTLYIDDDRND